MRIFIYWLCAGPLLTLTACGVNPHAATQLDSELQALMSLWQGEYAPDSGIQGPIQPYVLVRPVDLPRFGDAVTYMEVRDRTREGRVLRQRLYVFNTASDRTLNSIKAYDFWGEAGAPYAGAYDVPTKLNDLDPQTMYTFPEGCEIEWRVANAAFFGEVSHTKCHIPSRTRGKTVSVDMILGITRDAFTQWEVGYDGSGNLEFGDPAAAPIRSNRVSPENP